MPVTATKLPGVLLVSFLLRDTDHDQVEIMCYVRHDGRGQLELNYSHHITRTRPVPHGPWTMEANSRHALNHLLSSTIETGVMAELWSSFRPKVRVLPAGLEEDIASVQW